MGWYGIGDVMSQDNLIIIVSRRLPIKRVLVLVGQRSYLLGALGLKARPSARATLGYLVYNMNPSVLNHSTLEFRDFSKRAPGSWNYVRSTYFWTLIPNHPTWRRVKMLPWPVIGKKKLLRSRDITWHGHLREKVKFLVSVRVLDVVWVMVVVKVMVSVRVEC